MSTSPPQKDELRVFISHRESQCDECKEVLGRQAWITLDRDKGALCLSCGDLDHLEFLPSGDAALTRRAKKHSKMTAVVLKFSRARRRYERQGLLVEEEALSQAESECLADQEARLRRAERERERRAELDHDYVQAFAQHVREMFPACPPGRELEIAEHACRKYSGRIGRSAEAKALSADAVRLAVVAHVRHYETDYDELLGRGWFRRQARSRVSDNVDQILDQWASGSV